jgi:hypothetical protein
MIYYSVSFVRLRLFLFDMPKQFSNEERQENLLFFDGMYVNFYRVERDRAQNGGGREKTAERLFVKQKYNNMPQASSIKIYISANNEREREDFSVNK